MGATENRSGFDAAAEVAGAADDTVAVEMARTRRDSEFEETGKARPEVIIEDTVNISPNRGIKPRLRVCWVVNHKTKQ